MSESDEIRKRQEQKEVRDSDRMQPRCGCMPTKLHLVGMTQFDEPLTAECLRCGAAWEWGAVCMGEGQP